MKNTLAKHINAAIALVVVVASFALIVNAAHAADATCTIATFAKKANAKSVYLANGSKMSLKSLEKFSGVCTIKTTIMSDAQIKAITIKELEARISKLSK